MFASKASVINSKTIPIRLASLLTAFVILASALVTPTPSRLVCRLSGAVMLVSSAPRKVSPCCAMHRSLTKAGITQEMLSKSSCCELRPSSEKTVTPTVMKSDFAFVYILTSEIATFIPPTYTQILPPNSAFMCVVLRGPPLKSHAPRGPPVFS
jgi:hypothetical protein